LYCFVSPADEKFHSGKKFFIQVLFRRANRAKKTLTIEIRACFAVVWGLTSFAFSLGRTKQYLLARKVSQLFMA